ncbi:Putative sugar transferase, fragment [Paracholeplasma brassicae]|uniref:Putative sugar transferase n=1 Tax=Acholeplasma brassicae TaxID=61635 RepID=U4KQS7_9MOLU|nr:hypothetical protein [Paracholeplasma brassicae]CCV65103.1 Putative sugar transferase, fragment [Paracholeplasma brassicae]
MIGIIHLINTEFSPYIKKYTSILDELQLEYEIVFWNRLNYEYTRKEFVVYNDYTPLETSKYKKALKFMRYRKFVNRILSQKKYSKVIFLTTLTGFLVNTKNLKKYRGKFIFDIRDYTYENNIFFRFFEKKIINYSRITTISSPYFKNFYQSSITYCPIT